MVEQRPVAEPGLRRSSEGTLHYQLYRTLSEMISNGTVKPGERMPTEFELVEMYGVSRTTARRALDELRRQGVVIRQSGRGTFVLPQRLSAAIPHLHSITEELEHLGYTAGIVPLSVERSKATEAVAADLRLALNDPVLVVRRVRTADGRPVYVGASTLNIHTFPNLAEQDYSAEGLYPLFERATGLEVTRAAQWLSAVPAPRDVAHHLEVKVSAPVLHLERIVFLAGDQPIETVSGYFHGELYKHYSESHRRRRHEPSIASGS